MKTATRSKKAKMPEIKTWTRNKRYRHAHHADYKPLIIAVAGIAVVALIAVLVTRAGKAQSKGEPTTAPVTVSGAALSPFQRGRADASIGKLAPEAGGIGFDRAPISIVNDGRAKAVVLLAHWCPHCRVEVPKVRDYLSTHRLPEDLDVVAVSTWADPSRVNYPPGPWLRAERWPVRTLVDSETSEVAKAFGLYETPMWVTVGRDGRVVQRVSGELTTQQLERLLANAAKA